MAMRELLLHPTMIQAVYNPCRASVNVDMGVPNVITPTEMKEVEITMDYSAYQHLLIEKKDGIALLTINRPESLNSTNFRLHYELSRVWLDLAADDEVRVAVI